LDPQKRERTAPASWAEEKMGGGAWRGGKKTYLLSGVKRVTWPTLNFKYGGRGVKSECIGYWQLGL